MHSDPIADLLTRIRNAVQAHKNSTSVPYSKIKEKTLEILKNKSFILDYKVEKKDGPTSDIKIDLNEEIKNLNLKRISKPGQRIYIKSSEIKKVRNGLGIQIISTSSGLLTGEEAKKQKLGGELICEVY